MQFILSSRYSTCPAIPCSPVDIFIGPSSCLRVSPLQSFPSMSPPIHLSTTHPPTHLFIPPSIHSHITLTPNISTTPHRLNPTKTQKQPTKPTRFLHHQTRQHRIPLNFPLCTIKHRSCAELTSESLSPPLNRIPSTIIDSPIRFPNQDKKSASFLNSGFLNSGFLPVFAPNHGFLKW